MTMRLRLTIVAIILSIGFHAYLTVHFYELKFGLSNEPSVCNVNETFDCDAVSASRFSSFLGIPVSIWGGLTNIVLLMLLLAYTLRFTDHPKRMLRYSFWLATFSAAASVVMGAISFSMLGTFCLFCIALYILSLIIFELLRESLPESPWPHLLEDIKGLFTHSTAILITLIGIPALSFIINSSMVNFYGADGLDRIVNSSLADWQQNPKATFDAAPSLSMGPNRDNAKLVIAEFADFRCSHCRNAAPSLHAFAKAHPDVRFEFYNFPLDGACNKTIQRSSGISCQLAKASHCAGQQPNAWAFHAAMFNAQSETIGATSITQVNELLGTLAKATKIDWSKVKVCIENPATQEAILAQAAVGVRAEVMGTPTIFANDKILPRGQLIPVLHGAYQAK